MTAALPDARTSSPAGAGTHLQKISGNAALPDTVSAAEPAVAFATAFAVTPAAAPVTWRFAPAAEALSGSAIREILKVTEQPAMLSFAGGLPNPAAFPVAAIRAASARVLADDAVGALQYGPTEGYAPLREQIAARLSAAGQATTADEVLITTGSQQALDLIGKAFLCPGATLLAANPSYLGALQAFALYQPRVLDLAADWQNRFDPARTPNVQGGSDSGGEAGKASGNPSGTHSGRKTEPAPPAFCYLTPTFANPDGSTLSSAERQALLARLQAANVPLIEDDPYGDLWIDAPPPPACRTLAPARTLYLGSFSKVLTPGLRVGYVAGPRPVIALLARLKQAADLHTPSLNQRIIAALLADGTLDAHLPALRTLYRQQRDALVGALDRHLRPYADWSAPAGGMFAWLRLKDGRDATELFAAALRQQVAFVPGAPFYFADADRSTLRLAYSTLAADQLDEGLRRLALACRELGQSKQPHRSPT